LDVTWQDRDVVVRSDQEQDQGRKSKPAGEAQLKYHSRWQLTSPDSGYSATGLGDLFEAAGRRVRWSLHLEDRRGFQPAAAQQLSRDTRVLRASSSHEDRTGSIGSIHNVSILT
jgi:hypothetical protein